MRTSSPLRWWLVPAIAISTCLATPSADAQVPTPKASSVAAGNWSVHLDQAQAALQQGELTQAVQQYRLARVVLSQADAATKTQASTRLNELRRSLVGRGLDVALLDLPPEQAQATTRPLESIPTAAAMPAAGSELAKKAEALRWTAMGRAALDRGDVAAAYQMAFRAQSLSVPDHTFAPGEPRPWQLMMDAQAAAKRRNLNLQKLAQSALAASPSAGNAGGVNQGVRPAGHQAASSDAAGTAVQNAMAFGSTGQTGQVAQVQNIEPLTDSSPGDELYQEGMEALTQGNQALAREKFVEAWKYEAQMDTETRRALRDKLTLLQPSRLPTTSKPDVPLTAIQKAELEAAAQTRRLYREVTTELAKANEKKEANPLEAVSDLERLLRRVEGSRLDDASKASLTAMVNRALTDQKQYVEAHRAEIELDIRNEAIRTEMSTEAARQARIDEEVSALVETYNDLMDQERFPEAEMVAKEVAELKPNSVIATSMFHASRTGTRLQMDQEIRDGAEEGFAMTMLDLGRTAIAPDPDRPFTFPEPQTWQGLSERRSGTNTDTHLSQREQEIKQRLKNTDVDLNYINRPLGEVLEVLSSVSNVPIVLDNRALSAARVNRDTPVTLSINSRISLRSALNILLSDLDLTYVLDNDVLNVTSKEARRTMVRTKTYRVADLVTPIPNFVSGHEYGLSGALKAAYQMIQPTTDVQVMPVSMTDLGGMANNSPRGSSMNPNVLGQYSPMASAGGFAGNGYGAAGAMRGGAGGGAMADFDSLMQLIQTTIQPDTWEAVGGVGTMAPYPQNLSLVISTTTEVHDEIVELLESLRKLQNLQITIEVRFITLADTFFEQIGIDFDVQFDDNATGLPTDDAGQSVTIGLSGPGTPTADFDIRLENNSAGVISPFGAPDAGAISSIGFAILSDIEAFFFLQAAQGDTRSSVMQAPKVTLFDGQMATIQDTTQRPFVTSVVPVVGDFAVAQQPVIVVLDEGTRLNVQAVVSDDKRFVRLTLVPTFSQIGDVNTFTFQGSRSTRNTSGDQTDTNGDGVIDENDEVDDAEEEIISTGTTVQQPTFASTSVSTTVSVPDGGTILLGGIKRMSEGRQERGIPFLSKIPYVSRLFRNVAIGREARSLMLMVTPRIIIQEEEEIAQTGFDPNQ